jgi:Uncharacterized conserved protein
MSNTIPTTIIADADGLAENSDPAFIVLVIFRTEIEARNIGGALERLLVLTDSKENVCLYRESVMFQVEGYDDDPRELPEIQEVRDYFRLLTNEWPHWLWFLHREIGGIPLLLALLCDVQVIRNGDGSYGTAFKDITRLRETLHVLLHRETALFRAYDISPEDAMDSARSALAEFSFEMDLP